MNDWLIALSTSGRSKNILNAITKARSMSINCLFLTSTGCILPEIDGLKIIRVQSDATARIQEVHEIIGHILCTILQTNMEMRNWE